MVTEQAKHMAEFFASIAKRTSKPDLDLATMRDINEGLHVCVTEPEGVTYADLTGLPPTMVYYGEAELLVGEAIAFAQRAKDAGVEVSLHSVPEGQHSFIHGAGRVPEVDEAIEQMGRWVRSKLGLAVLAAA